MLSGAGWLLTAPNGQAVKLTAAEFAFLNLLCGRGGEVRTRSELMAITARPRSQFDDRHLDAVVSRLRRKIERSTNLPIPLQVVYGVGYSFTAPVLVE